MGLLQYNIVACKRAGILCLRTDNNVLIEAFAHSKLPSMSANSLARIIVIKYDDRNYYFCQHRISTTLFRLYLVYACKLQSAIGILSNETDALSFIPAVIIGLDGHLGFGVKLEIRILIKHCTSETDARL